MLFNCRKECKKVDRKDLEFLMKLLGLNRVYVMDEIRKYLGENGLEGVSIMPEVMVEALNEEETSIVMAYAKEQNIKVVVREVTNQSVEYSAPVYGGIMINFDKSNIAV